VRTSGAEAKRRLVGRKGTAGERDVDLVVQASRGENTPAWITRSYFSCRRDGTAMDPPLLQGSTDGTRAVDPIGTAIVLLLVVLGAYAARQSWQQYRTGDPRLRWVVAAGLGVSIAVLGTVSLLLDLAAVLGLL
jgi:hypothetical protein